MYDKMTFKKGDRIMEQYMPIIWISFAVIMVVCEAFTTQLVSIWFVLGAACAAISTAFNAPIWLQSTIFIGVSLISLAITRPLVKKMRKNNAMVSTNSDSLVGKIGYLMGDLPDKETVCQMKIEGKIWSAKAQNPPLKKDARVRVLSIEGVKLIVKSAQDE